MHAAVLLLELGGVLLGLGLLGRLAGRIGLSPIPLYLLAGLAFGKGGLLPLVTAREFIQVGAEIGIILLLLLLGLEYSARELLGTLRAAAPAGVGDLLLDFPPGLAAGLLLGWGPLAAVVLGGVTYISSSGVAAKVLGDLGRHGNRETPVVLSILVLEDLAMAVYLPVVTVLLAGGTLASSLLPATLAVAAVAAVLAATLRYGSTLSRLVFSPNDEVLLLKLLGVAFIVAGAAQAAQVSAAVGAFLVGIALSGPAARGARALLSPLRDLFAAVFFVFFGLQTDPRQLPPVALAATGLALATTLTKLAGGWWAARRAGIATPGRLRAGAVLVARGEFSIVIAGLAVAAGLHPQLGPLAATYVLLLAVAGPILARLADPVAARLRRPGEPRPPGPQTRARTSPAELPPPAPCPRKPKMPPPPEPCRSGHTSHEPDGPLRAVGRWAPTAATRPWRYAATWASAIGVANLAVRTVLNAQSVWQNAAWAALVALALFAGIGLSASVLASRRRHLAGQTPPAPQRTGGAGESPAASHHPVIRVRGVRSSGARPNRRSGRWRH